MNQIDKIQELRNYIRQSLVPLIDNDYIFIELPYYVNPGDALIWSGTECFLNELPYKCLYRASFTTFQYRPLSEDTLIIMQGGGNFGDLYRDNQNLRLTVVEKYPNNRIIVLPQTVYYKGGAFLYSDIRIMRQHKKLTLCARDEYSYNFLCRYQFSDKVLLVPDMAFYNDISELEKYALPIRRKQLLFSRIDAEKSSSIWLQQFMSQTNTEDIHDWSVMEILQDYSKQLIDMLQTGDLNAIDEYALTTFMPDQIKSAVEQISQYEKVIATRLHAAILSILLGKEVVILDNSYGKNVHFFNTWLKSTERVTCLSEEVVSPVISIIIPVYNVEQYLNQCLESVVGQTYRNLEIILIDDGSTDKSSSMCDDWAKRDARIKVIHKENGGLSDARNAGLDVATGEYIGFLDSDDYVDAMMYEKLLDAFPDDDKDVAITACLFHTDVNGDIAVMKEEWDFENSVLLEGKDFARSKICQTTPHPVWNKLYRKSLLQGLKFRVGLNNEDTLFMYDLGKVMKARGCKELVIPEYLHFYRIRENGICRNKEHFFQMQIVRNLKKLLEESENTNDGLADDIRKELKKESMSAIWMLLDAPQSAEKGCTHLELVDLLRVFKEYRDKESSAFMGKIQQYEAISHQLQRKIKKLRRARTNYAILGSFLFIISIVSILLYRFYI